MCMSSTPSIPEPQKPQEAKMPAQMATGATGEARKRMAQYGGAASTLLTGPSGVENSSLQLRSGSTLLGA